MAAVAVMEVVVREASVAAVVAGLAVALVAAVEADVTGDLEAIRAVVCPGL